jgi:protein TonB
MPASNTGSGPRSVSVNFGNGAPSGTDLNGKSHSPVKIAGLATGVPGGTGTGRNGPVRVEIAPPPPPAPASHGPSVVQASTTSKPTLIYKPEPVYSAEAKAMHLEGNVTLHIRIRSNGTTEVLNVVHGLGHGLDESAVAATRATRFRPAMDSAGHAVDYETNVVVTFQMS